MEKARTIERVAEATLHVLNTKGLARMNHTEVSRRSGVSRAWIYKYVGSSRQLLVQFAVDHFGSVLAQLDSRARVMGRDQWLKDFEEGTENLLEMAVSHPDIMPLYFRHRGMDDPVGDRIDAVESRYLRTLSQEMSDALKLSKNRTELMAELLLGMRMGLALRWQMRVKRDPKLLGLRTLLCQVVTEWAKTLIERTAPTK